MVERRCEHCDTGHYARGLCYRHYMQWFRTGKVRPGAIQTESDRFWSKVAKAPGCWVWQGAQFSTGYGQVKFRGSTRLAHRVAWLLAVGEPVPAMLHHTCETKLCVRPDHLEPTSRQRHADEHRRLGSASGHGRETHCPAGHAYDDANTYVDRGGSRHCRSCARERRRAHPRERDQAPPEG